MIATDINYEKLKELKEEQPSIEIGQLDVTKGSDVERMFKEKHLDVNVLFNCAGYTVCMDTVCVHVWMLAGNLQTWYPLDTLSHIPSYYTLAKVDLPCIK